MSASITRAATFTITDARYIGSKVGADLRLLHNLYGQPSIAKIDDLAEEVALLLKDGYLGTVDYGFRDADNNTWKLRLRYRATTGGQLLDSRPGNLPRAVEVECSPFHSYLKYSQKFHGLTADEQHRVEQTLPTNRVGADEPSALSGLLSTGHGYARNGSGVSRDLYVAS